MLWELVKDSGEVGDFQVYLRRYPNGRYASEAQQRVSQLQAAAKKDEFKPSSPAATTSSRGAPVPNRYDVEMVWIPPGSFEMGSNSRYNDETPVHRVTLSKGFYMGKYEVTQKLWQAVMGANPSYFNGDNLPVEQVSWDDAQKFINKLNEMNDGYTYRLPTEAEWEYACRAGTTGEYAGDLDEMAWYRDNSGKKTHAVGTKQPNAWGLYDMHGNVWEWCADYWHNDYHGAPADGSIWVTGGDAGIRMLRGGSWHNDTILCRSAYRNFYISLTFRDSMLGLRLVAVARSS